MGHLRPWRLQPYEPADGKDHGMSVTLVAGRIGLTRVLSICEYMYHLFAHLSIPAIFSTEKSSKDSALSRSKHPFLSLPTTTVASTNTTT